MFCLEGNIFVTNIHTSYRKWNVLQQMYTSCFRNAEFCIIYLYFVQRMICNQYVVCSEDDGFPCISQKSWTIGAAPHPPHLFRPASCALHVWTINSLSFWTIWFEIVLGLNTFVHDVAWMDINALSYESLSELKIFISKTGECTLEVRTNKTSWRRIAKRTVKKNSSRTFPKYIVAHSDKKSLD